ncbi:MAG: hypothetical protein M3220_08790 [Chloroflexota bacterium]|nr:hypothetical protein [Chloroflexota bacterium]
MTEDAAEEDGSEDVFLDDLEPANPTREVMEELGDDEEVIITPTLDLVDASTPTDMMGRFSNLRFAPGSDAVPQSDFPLGTEEVCAIWDYRDMEPTDTVRRVWYWNDEIYVERQESWDFSEYGASGTIRDVCLFDRIDGHIDGIVDGIDPGYWRVEVFLNDERPLLEEFAVGTS